MECTIDSDGLAPCCHFCGLVISQEQYIETGLCSDCDDRSTHISKTPTELLEALATTTERMEIRSVDGGFCIDAETSDHWIVQCASSIVAAIQDAAREAGIPIEAD